MKLTIASWNILNDAYVPKHESQSKRLDQVIQEVAKVQQTAGSMSLFLCEVMSPSHFDRIADETGMVVAGKPVHYRGGQKEYCGFLVSKDLASVAKQRQIIIYDGNHNSIVALDIGDRTIAGTHLPVKVMFEMGARKSHVDAMLKESPDIFSGDFNATPLFPLRHRITRAGYQEAHAQERPPFPHPYYRGKNLHF